MPMIPMTRKATLKQLRTEKGWTQKELSSRSGVSANVISRIESNVSELRVRIETAQSLGEALGCDWRQIEWPNGVSRTGRYPQSSGIEVTRVTIIVSQEVICERCFVVLPQTGICDTCG